MSAFELVGFDILVTDQWKVYVLEINHTPSLSPHTELENRVKKEMIHELFDLVDVENKRYDLVHNLADEYYSIVENLRVKNKIELNQTKQIKPWSDELEIQIEKLSKIDILSLIDTVIQNTNTGKFEIGYPGKDAFKYWDILPCNNRTKLMAIWIHKNYQLDQFFKE